MKVEKISQILSPFAGIYFADKVFDQCGLSKLIDKELGMRSQYAGYQYSEIFRTIFHIFFCGGDRMEDVQSHLRPTLESIPFNKVPSADTLLRGIKELATPNTTVISSSGKSYSFNINKKMKHTKGYFPGIATIGQRIVYIENRDGNANVKTAQVQTLGRAYGLLKSRGIKINRSRMDAGSYAEEIVRLVCKDSRLFYIRSNKCDALKERVREITDWQTQEINFKTYQVASLPFTAFMQENGFRLVVMREKNADGQADLFTGDDFIYRCILTNNFLLEKIAEVFSGISSASRIKRFIFRFISVCGKWVRQSRQWKLRLYTDRPYEKLNFST